MVQLFTAYYPEVKTVIGFIFNDVYVNEGKIHFDGIYKAFKPFVELPNVCYYYYLKRAIQTL